MPRIIALADSLECKPFFRFLLGPEWLNIRNLPKSAKLEIISYLTKLDGTAKGGVIFAIADKFGIPIRYIGVGERIEDLRPFKADDFIEALFSKEIE